jgi:hypothetical protein
MGTKFHQCPTERAPIQVVEHSSEDLALAHYRIRWKDIRRIVFAEDDPQDACEYLAEQVLSNPSRVDFLPDAMLEIIDESLNPKTRLLNVLKTYLVSVPDSVLAAVVATLSFLLSQHAANRIKERMKEGRRARLEAAFHGHLDRLRERAD